MLFPVLRPGRAASGVNSSALIQKGSQSTPAAPPILPPPGCTTTATQLPPGCSCKAVWAAVVAGTRYRGLTGCTAFPVDARSVCVAEGCSTRRNNGKLFTCLCPQG